jgi:energy-coupling factor transporter ATP-binding protein EcfA2
MQSKNLQIFLSYGHDEHSDIVLKIKEYLEQQGYIVFIDSEQLHTGNDWEYKLEKAIQSSDKIIFFITPYSARRPDGYCLNELAMALFYKKEILPIMLKFCIPPLSIARKQFLDFQEIRNKSNNNKVLKEKVQYLVDVIENNLELTFEGEHAKLYEELKPIDFTQDLTKHKKIMGREWISDEVSNWTENYPASKILWFTGEAGYGKSTIATYLANTLPNVIGIHFCSFNYPSKNDPKNLIKSLAFYLTSQIPELKNEIQNIEIKKLITSNELFEQLILNPLQKVQKQKTYIFIIDALDESMKKNQYPLANLIRDEFYKLPSNIKIILTSRFDTRLNQVLSNLNPYILKADDEKNILDCKKYIIDFLSENKHADLIDDFQWIQKLLEKSQSNMLYLTKFFEDVNNGFFDIYSLETFPNSLNGLYVEFFNRIIIDENDYYDNYAPMFEILVISESPVSLELLSSVLNIDKIQLKRKLNKFSSLLKFENDKVNFYHKSINDWLLAEDNAYFQVNPKNGYKEIYEFTKDLDLDQIPIELLELFSKAVVKLDKQDAKYEKYFVDFIKKQNELIDNEKNYIFNKNIFSYILDFSYIFLSEQDIGFNEATKKLSKIKYYYLLSKNNEYHLLNNLSYSKQYISILANYKQFEAKEKWGETKREALSYITNAIELVSLMNDKEVYNYLVKEEIMIGFDYIYYVDPYPEVSMQATDMAQWVYEKLMKNINKHVS